MPTKRGRKSSAELNVVTVNLLTRPDAPESLNHRQKEVWDEVVSGEPVDFFQTGALQLLLASYCRHIEASEKASAVIDEFQTQWLKSEEGARRYDHLCKVRERETRAASSMATKLRITNQARYTPKAAATAAKNTTKLAKPWET